ncbi:phosphopyruvate hydratase [Candidatus Woesebacteria bacterium]|nr:phosphopyruvate hydratase [Candidatus Woesebacteria bacterium]
MNITSLQAIEILDSRGKPTIRTFLTLDDGSVHAASVPSGASTGAHEAVELRDGDKKRHMGQGVTKAVHNVNTSIANILKNRSVNDITALDKAMIELDGTENKGKLGANAILSVSMAAVRAAAYTEKKPVWKFLNEHFFAEIKPDFPRLMVNLINGGKHANWNFDIQEFIIMTKATLPSVSTQVAAEIFLQLGKQLKKKGLSPLVGDEGGYSPALTSNEQAYEEILTAASTAGYKNIEDFEFGMDAAATEFYENGTYTLKRDNKTVSPDQLIEYYSQLGQKYHIQSFEDPFAEDDWGTFTKFATMADKFHFQIVGDDLFVTNPKRIEKGIREKAANAVLIKLNQIGSVSETAEAIRMTQQAGWKVAVSHRSGETEDPFIADLAYACAAEFIKTGSMSRSERLAKYNRLIEIEHGF